MAEHAKIMTRFPIANKDKHLLEIAMTGEDYEISSQVKKTMITAAFGTVYGPGPHYMHPALAKRMHMWYQIQEDPNDDFVWCHTLTPKEVIDWYKAHRDIKIMPYEVFPPGSFLGHAMVENIRIVDFMAFVKEQEIYHKMCKQEGVLVKDRGTPAGFEEAKQAKKDMDANAKKKKK